MNKNCHPSQPSVPTATQSLQGRGRVVTNSQPSVPIVNEVRVVHVDSRPQRPAANVYNFLTSPPGINGGLETTINTPAATWVIPHLFGRRPDVAVYDSAGNMMIADVQSSATMTTITFAVPTAGSAVLS